MANAKNKAEITTLMIESLIDSSLPYLVYITKIVNEINPIMRKIHAKTQIVREGISAILLTLIFL
jgi:hypothetical protein